VKFHCGFFVDNLGNNWQLINILFCGYLYLLTSAVNRNINIYKQEDGSGTLTHREPITLVTCCKVILQNFTTYNLNIKQEYSIIFLYELEREHKNFKIWKNKMTKL
jgi:hypothetical protein